MKIYNAHLQTHIHPRNLSIESYDYPLPDEKIAQYPLGKRDSSKLLIVRNNAVQSDVFSNLAEFLPPGSLMVFNETRVIHARLLFRKATGSPVEIFCLEPLAPWRDHQQALQQMAWSEWLCLVGNSKRWKQGTVELAVNHNGQDISLRAERLEKKESGSSRVRFSWTPEKLTFAEILEYAGKIPLPPYISRKPEVKDDETYQTIYARQDGSVAAPTAGLHFTGKVMDSLGEQNIDTVKFILHVGAGTFRPVVTSDLAGHEMHSEKVFIPIKSLKTLRASLHKPIIAVGTTTTRLMESLYWHGVKVIRGKSDAASMAVDQWDPYNDAGKEEITREESLDAVIDGCIKAGTDVLEGKTSLLIAPGYRFRYPDILITNFHQPKSTLLLLIAAFIGEDWRKAYQYALDHNFRFLSYGDSCLFYRNNNL